MDHSATSPILAGGLVSRRHPARGATLVATLAVVAGLCASGTDVRGAPYRRPNQNNQAEVKQTVDQIRADLSLARTNLTEANAKVAAIKSGLEEAKKKNTEGQSTADAAEKEIHSAAQKLHEIETQLLEAQPADSKIAKAKAQLDAARKAIEKYRADNGVTAGAVVEDPEYKTLKDGLKEANRDYEKLTAALFEASAEWTTAADEAKAARDKEAAAKESSSGVAGGSRKELKKAMSAVETAKKTIAADEAQLRAMGVPIDPPTKKKK